MRCLLTPLAVVISVITMTHPANANDVNFPPPNSARGQASALTTQPITTTNGAANVIDHNRLRQIADSIPGKRAPLSRRVNPLDFFSDPITTLERFAQQNQKPQRVEPLEFFKVPALDSGVSVPVTDF